MIDNTADKLPSDTIPDGARPPVDGEGSGEGGGPSSAGEATLSPKPPPGQVFNWWVTGVAALGVALSVGLASVQYGIKEGRARAEALDYRPIASESEILIKEVMRPQPAISRYSRKSDRVGGSIPRVVLLEGSWRIQNVGDHQIALRGLEVTVSRFDYSPLVPPTPLIVEFPSNDPRMVWTQLIHVSNIEGVANSPSGALGSGLPFGELDPGESLAGHLPVYLPVEETSWLAIDVRVVVDLRVAGVVEPYEYFHSNIVSASLESVPGSQK